MKLGETGDGVRTTTMLHVLGGEIFWLSAGNNMDLIDSLPEMKHCIARKHRQRLSGQIV